MAVERVKLRHPTTGEEWDCPARAVDAWVEKGWQRAEKTTAAPARRRGEGTEGAKSNG